MILIYLFAMTADIIKHTLKTNVYMNNRYALGFRLDPKIMVSENEPPRDSPYGIIFVHGRRFDGYHVRFRDIARGGLRLVTPASSEQFALEAAHQYDECYGLAFAQQLKNKDIPEGGSKAVVLVDSVGVSNSSRDFIMRKAVKGFADTILDLVVDTDETRREIVDFVGKKEVLYLGPDEQVIPEDINWVSFSLYLCNKCLVFRERGLYTHNCFIFIGCEKSRPTRIRNSCSFHVKQAPCRNQSQGVRRNIRGSQCIS